jgi:hypothetical protein
MPLSANVRLGLRTILRTKPLGLAWQSDGNGALSGLRAKPRRQVTIRRYNTGHALSGGLIIEMHVD